MNHSYYLPWSKEGKYKYILCGYKYYGVEVGPYYRSISIIFISRKIISVCIYPKGKNKVVWYDVGENIREKTCQITIIPKPEPL